MMPLWTRPPWLAIKSKRKLCRYFWLVLVVPALIRSLASKTWKTTPSCRNIMKMRYRANSDIRDVVVDLPWMKVTPSPMKIQRYARKYIKNVELKEIHSKISVCAGLQYLNVTSCRCLLSPALSATDEKTLAFYHGYQGDLNDEAVKDFAYLNEENDEQAEDEEPEEGEEQTGYRGEAAFKERLIEAARMKDVSVHFIPTFDSG